MLAVIWVFLADGLRCSFNIFTYMFFLLISPFQTGHESCNFFSDIICFTFESEGNLLDFVRITFVGIFADEELVTRTDFQL